jgi:uncharacterized phage protein (TIGR01671 family)
MRDDILFRGKRLSKYDRKRSWVYGVPVVDDINKEISIVTSNTVRIVNKDTVGEFTGLYDINDTPIFEGDIVLTQDFRTRSNFSSKSCKTMKFKGVVEHIIEKGSGFYNKETDKNDLTVWYGSKFDVCLIDFDEKYCHYSWSKFWGCQVIGNIHDNPELLKIPGKD